MEPIWTNKLRTLNVLTNFNFHFGSHFFWLYCMVIPCMLCSISYYLFFGLAINNVPTIKSNFSTSEDLMIDSYENIPLNNMIEYSISLLLQNFLIPLYRITKAFLTDSINILYLRTNLGGTGSRNPPKSGQALNDTTYGQGGDEPHSQPSVSYKKKMLI